MSATPKYVIGIGASAGGLEAIQEFFNNMPKSDEFTFIVMQHLSPDFNSVMGELLTHNTAMPIQTAEENMRLKSGVIYLIPATYEAQIENDCFIFRKINRNAHPKPIDTLFESLANAYTHSVIGIILSGTGSDGTLGMVSIAQHNGLTLVQTPTEAKFTDMPIHAIATKEINYVLSASEMPSIILEYTDDPTDFNKSVKQILPINESDYSDIFHMLNSQFHSDFSVYKIGTMSRRIQRRMQLLGIEHLSDYVAYLTQHTEGIKILYQDLLVGVTEFFRDPPAFAILSSVVIPELVKQATKSEEEIRIWIGACATGEEAYSVAMLVKKYTDEHNLPFSVKIFATDVSPHFIQKAKRGRYSYQEAAKIPPDLLNKYFIKCADCYEVISEIKQQILFITHNLLVDPPFTKLDLICCRNLMIYIKSQEQKRVLDLLRFSLKIGGFLFLGPSEGPSSIKPELMVVNQPWKIFKKTKHSNFPKIAAPLSHKPFIQGLYSPSARSNAGESLPIYAYNAILREAVSSGFVVDTSYEILHSIGKARDMLILPEGAPSLILTKLIIDELKGALIAALHQAKIKLIPVIYDNIEIPKANKKHQHIKMTVHPICDKNHKISYYWIRLDPVTVPIKKQAVITISDSQKQTHHDEIIIALEEELSEARVMLQSSLENMETVNEEMQSTNEELMASNEELQSANEELRSVNEKLNVVNLERETKIEEVVQAKDDIDNLIRSAEICTIILNAKLEIRIFTPGIKKIFTLMEHDIGRSLENFQHNLKFDLFLSKATEVLKSNNTFESEIKNNDNQWYLLKITPYYASQSKVVTGIVITFTDINHLKLLQEEKEKIEKNLRLALKTGVIGIWHCDVNTNSFNHDETIMNMYGLHNHATMNHLDNFIEAIHLDDRKRIEAALEATMAKQEDFEQNFRIYRPDGSIRYVSCSANSHENIADASKYLTGICWDITEKYWLEEKIIDAEHLNLGLDAITDGWWDWDLVNNEVYLSPLLKNTFGYQGHELTNRIESYEQLMIPEDLLTVRHTMEEYIKADSNDPMIQEVRFKHKSGEIVWVLLRRKGILDKQNKLVRMIGTLTKITDLKETELSLEKLAYRDFMTQVPNKPAFSDALVRAIARGKRKQTAFAVLYVDIDNFKDINDQWGHSFGDKVLCEVADRLTNASRAIDFLARLGGDEFGILLEDLTNQQEIVAISNRYLSVFSEPLQVDTTAVAITLSIGIALYPEHGETDQTLLQYADQAMYRAKKLGKNQVSL